MMTKREETRERDSVKKQTNTLKLDCLYYLLKNLPCKQHISYIIVRFRKQNSTFPSLAVSFMNCPYSSPGCATFLLHY